MFFFKQKTAYEIEYGLVGSEMCIRDRGWCCRPCGTGIDMLRGPNCGGGELKIIVAMLERACLLYTSDAADERSSVDLGGRRIIKKQTRINTYPHHARLSNTEIQEPTIGEHTHTTEKKTYE